LDIHPFGMFCNRTLFKEAGLTNSAGDILIPQTQKEFLDAIRRMTRDTDGDGKIDQWGYVLTTMRMIFKSVMTQYGGTLVSDDGRTCLLNSPENRKTMQFFYDLVYSENVCPKPDGFDSWVGFRQGKVGIVFEGVWMLSELEKSDLDYVGAPFPQIGDRPGAWAGSHVMCLSKTAGTRQKEAGWRLIKYLSDHSLEWAQTGMIPVRKSLRATDTFQAMKVQNAFARLIPHAYFTPAVPYDLELDAELELAFEKVLRQTETPEEALRVAEKNINEIIVRVYADRHNVDGK
jgi:multiple sugar transport system substrate-binding protein